MRVRTSGSLLGPVRSLTVRGRALPRRCAARRGAGTASRVSSAACQRRHPRPAGGPCEPKRTGRVYGVTRVITCLSLITLDSPNTGPAGRRRGTLPTPTQPSTPCPAEKLLAGADGPGRAAESARAAGARPRLRRKGWGTRRERSEVGGHDRVELRVHPGRIGADQLGEPTGRRRAGDRIAGGIRLLWLQTCRVQHPRSLPGNVVVLDTRSCTASIHIYSKHWRLCQVLVLDNL